MSDFKSGFVAICGRPNVGKSTILNKLVGQKVAIVSPRPQTTRNKITGVYTKDDCQIVFLDTPGIHTPKNELGKYMLKQVSSGTKGVDLILMVVEPNDKITQTELKMTEDYKLNDRKVVLVINKIDTVKKEVLMPVISAYSELMDFAAIIPVSAKHNDGLEALLDEIKKHLSKGPKYFPDDMVSDQPEKQIVCEIIREKILRLLDKEVPHGVAVEMQYMNMRQDSDVCDISVVIFCEKESHKGIIIGKNGQMLKKIGSYAREDIEKIFDCRAFIECWVKVKENWRNNSNMVKNFGYKD